VSKTNFAGFDRTRCRPASYPHPILLSGGKRPIDFDVAAGFRREGLEMTIRLVHSLRLMGAQWKQAGREQAAQKKGQVVGKLVREIMVAAKLGGADPDSNARLSVALDKARKSNVTRDTIDRASIMGSGQLDDGTSI
jgi:hypothetical protein